VRNCGYEKIPGGYGLQVVTSSSGASGGENVTRELVGACGSLVADQVHFPSPSLAGQPSGHDERRRGV